MLDCVGQDLGTVKRLVDMTDVGVSWVGNEEIRPQNYKPKRLQNSRDSETCLGCVCHKCLVDGPACCAAITGFYPGDKFTLALGLQCRCKQRGKVSTFL